MKRVALIILIVIDIIGGFLGFISLLITNWLLALISLPLIALSIVPWIVLLEHITQIEDMQIQISHLQSKVYILEKELSSTEEKPIAGSFTYATEQSASKTTASSRWECVKCGAVNRENSSVCESCGAQFSCEQKQVFNAPLTKWKLKEKRKS